MFFFDSGRAPTESVPFSEEMILCNPESAEQESVEVATVLVRRLREDVVDERLQFFGKASCTHARKTLFIQSHTQCQYEHILKSVLTRCERVELGTTAAVLMEFD